MSSLARYFKSKGFPVGGYDKTATALTKTLESEGIEIHFEDLRHEGKAACARESSVGRFKSEYAAQRRRHADRAIGVGAERQGHQPPRHGTA